MVDLGSKELNKELKKLKNEKIPSLDEIKKENEELSRKEDLFAKKFSPKKKKK